VTDAPSPDPTLDQRRLLLEQLDARMETQSDELDGLDRKATTVLVATGVLLGLVVNNARDFPTSPPLLPLALYGSLAVLAVALFAGVWSLWPSRFAVVPEPGPFLAQYATRMPVDTMGELLSTKADAFNGNAKVARKKANRLRFQMVLLAVGGGLLVGAYILERLV
jgi:hypothetical protein